MKLKLLFIGLALLFLIDKRLFSQEEDTHPKNVIKLNLGALAFTNVSLQYERAIHKNFSMALQGGFILPRPIPERFMQNNEDFSDLNFSGFNLAPEIRFYPGKKESKQAPRGFYLAPYGRFSRFAATAYFMYPDSNQNPVQNVPVDFKASFTGFGGGLMFGAQFIIAKKVSIDWWIIGGHFGVAKVEGYMDSQLVYDNQYSFYEELENVEIPYGTKTFEVSGSRASITLSGIPFGGVRSGFCIGFAF